MIVDRILAIAELVQRLCVFAEGENIHSYVYEISIGRNAEFPFTGVKLKFFSATDWKVITVSKQISDIEIYSSLCIHDYLDEKAREYMKDWEHYKRTGELPKRD